MLVERVRRVRRRGAVWLDHAALRVNGGDYRRLQGLTAIAASRVDPPYLFHTWDREMGPHVWREGGYDSSEMKWTLDFLGHPQRGKSVVEVGANIGTSTVPLVTEYGARRVVAFEPEPRNVKLLRCNLILHDVEDKVDLQPVAVSDSRSTLRMELCDWNGGDHRIAPVDRSELADWDDADRKGILVDAVRLDEVELPDDVALMWVDTQGHEASVLAGAPDLSVPWVVEYWPYVLRRANGLEQMNRLLSERFAQIIDVRASIESATTVKVPAGGLEELGARLGGRYTDLILLPS